MVLNPLKYPTIEPAAQYKPHLPAINAQNEAWIPHDSSHIGIPEIISSQPVTK